LVLATEKLGGITGRGISELDRDLFRWVVTHRVEQLDAFFVALTRLGYGGAIWIVLGLGTALALRRPAIVPLTAVTVWGADLLSLGIKVAIGRPRPFVLFPDPEPLLVGVLGNSFPSGHAATSFAGAALLSRYLPGRWPVLYLLAVGIAFSRVYIGVHYPADVVGGAILGLLTAIALPLLAASLLRLGRAPPPG
jgi:undecaprenyl-diphosphatase